MELLAPFGIRAEYISGSNPINNDYHTKNEYEMFLLLEKEAECYIEQSCYKLTRGSLLLIAPNEVRKLSDIEDAELSCVSVCFEPSRIRDLRDEGKKLFDCFLNRKPGENNMITLDERRIAEYVRLADKIINCSIGDAYGNDVLAFTYLLQLLVLTNQMYNNSKPVIPDAMPVRVQPILKYIDEHLDEELTVASIAHALSMSRSNISKVFKEETDSTIHNYIISRRIVYAQKLLQQGHNVTETCYLAGFNDYASFIRCFKRITGNPPGVYKSKWRG